MRLYLHPHPATASTPPPLDVDAILVDLDGTLVNTLGDFAEALRLTLADMQLPAVPASAIALMVGKGTEHLLHSVLQRVLTPDLSPATADPQTLTAAIARHMPEMLQRYQRHYLAINGQHSSIYPGAKDGLLALRRAGLRLACVTNKPYAFTAPLLRAKGLDGLFDHVFGGDAFPHKKPHPLPLLKACEALGTLPAHTLMLGDSSNDAQAAHAAGCPVVLMTYGYNHGQPIHSVPAHGYADAITELLPPSAQPGASAQPQIRPAPAA